MDDVSDFFKSALISLHKNAIGKNYQQKTLKDRMNSFNNIRQKTRNTLLYERRHINENMTPINSPDFSKIAKRSVEKREEKKPNKRLEMLNKWKMEKEKRKQAEKQKTKPRFKVYHVPVDVGLPKLENINKEIKGKPISQFAPLNHKFQPPKNLQPINVSTNSNNKSLLKPKITQKINSLDASKSVPRNKSVIAQKDKTASHRMEMIESAKLSQKTKQNSTSQKCEINLGGNKGNAKKNISSKRTATVDNKIETRNGSRSKIEQSQNQNQSKGNLLNHHKNPESKQVIVKSQSTNTKYSTPKKTRNNKDVKSKSVILSSEVTLCASPISTKGKKIQNVEYRTPVTNRKTINSKIKSREMCPPEKKQEIIDNLQEFKENSFKASSKLKKPKNVSLKRSVGWNVIEIVNSDDEVFSKNINSKTPKKTPKKYNKTPKKCKKPEEIDDIKTEKLNRAKATETEENSSTPKNKKFDRSPVYISPFVTVSRGKTSARKEYQVRQSTSSVPSTPEFSKIISDNISPKVGAEYFTKKLNNEITRIENMCKEWNTYRDENNVPEEVNDLIDVAVGQSQLLISKKFKQFRNLIEQCRICDYVEKSITCEDLHGFWDMIYMQVGDLNKRFKNLEDLKLNNWQEVIPVNKTTFKRGRGRPKKVSATSALKDIIKAARKNKNSNSAPLVSLSDEDKLFSGGCYSIKSPIREQNIPNPRHSSSRRSLRVSLLTNQVKNRISSPGLTMMKISQAIKHGDGLTPSKSILKSDLTKSATRGIKSVLFKDNLEEDIEKNLNCKKSMPLTSAEDNPNKENDFNDINLITFSPQTTPRRSRRLNRIN